MSQAEILEAQLSAAPAASTPHAAQVQVEETVFILVIYLRGSHLALEVAHSRGSGRNLGMVEHPCYPRAAGGYEGTML